MFSKAVVPLMEASPAGQQAELLDLKSSPDAERGTGNGERGTEV